MRRSIRLGSRLLSIGCLLFTWVALAPRAEPYANAQGVRQCHASDLDGIWGRTTAATGGQLWGSVVLSNLSEEACELTGIPVVEVLDAEGTPLAVTIRPCGPSSSPGPYGCELESAVDLDSGGRLLTDTRLPTGQA